MVKLFGILCLTLLSTSLFAQIKRHKDKQSIVNVCDKIMQVIMDEKYLEAVDLLKQNSIIESEKLDTLAVTIIDHMEYIGQSYGKKISSEFITEKNIKDFLTSRYYIMRLEQFYIKFHFILYNNGTGWIITGFRYNEEIEDLH